MARSDGGRGGGRRLYHLVQNLKTFYSVKSFSEENKKFIFGDMKNMWAARKLCLRFGLVA